MLPTYSQAKKVIWDSLNNDGERILDYFPEQLLTQKNSQEMKIRFGNGSLFQLIGSDNIDSLMGTNPKIVVFSEYAMQSPTAWQYIRPILKVNGGTAIFISTPRGKNHFHDLVQIANDNKATWFCEKLTIAETNVLNEADMDNERKDGMSEEMIQQEYYCSFELGIEGSYYGKLIDKMRNESRICSVRYEPRSNVHTAWDIGYGDSTAIVFWQVVGTEVRIIDHYENHGESLEHYIKIVKNKDYLYGTHFFPHDAGAGSLQTGKSVGQLAYELGLPNTILARDQIEVGIEAVRAMLPITYIDSEKCKYLIKCLENYARRRNEATNSYSPTPLHNFASHSADAFRYCAMARRDHAGSGGTSSSKLREFQEKHRGMIYSI